MPDRPGPDPRPERRPAPETRPERWPGPAGLPGVRVLLVAATAGLLAAGLVPIDRPGLGWALGALVCGVAIAIGLGRAGDRPRRRETAGWGLAAIALLGAGSVRAAGWVFGICLLAAAVATVLALTDGRTVRGLAQGTALVPAAMIRAAGWAGRGIATLRPTTRPGARLIPTVAVTALVLLVFGGLLASADAAFSRALGRAVPDLAAGPVFRGVVLFAGGAGLVLAAVYLLLAPPTVDPDQPRPRGPRVRLIEWAVPAGALVALFASFVVVQLTVLFGGRAYVLEAPGATYAEHARGGFWQLLAVTALTLLVIGLVAWAAPRRTPLERSALRGLLGALALLTLVIVASALFRMHIYQEAYGFTRLRVLVSLVELWLGVVFLLVLVAGVRLRATWLPRAVTASAVAAVLALVALNPDHLIAARNLERAAAGEQLDVAYLAGLSADATPALICLPEPQREVALARIRQALADLPDDWRSANLARSHARDLLAAAGPCPPPGG